MILKKFIDHLKINQILENQFNGPTELIRKFEFNYFNELIRIENLINLMNNLMIFLFKFIL